MKKLILFLLMVVAVSGYAQKATVKWGATLNVNDDDYFKILGSDNKNVYVLRMDYRKESKASMPFLEAYDKEKMLPSFSKLLQIPKLKGEGLSIEGVLFLRTKFVMLITSKDKVDKTTTVFAFEISKDGIVNQKYTEVFTSEKLSSVILKDEIDYILTPDSTHFAIVHKTIRSYINSGLKYNDAYNVVVCDNNLNILRNEKITTILDELTFSYGINYKMDNELNFHAFCVLSKNTNAWAKTQFFYFEYNDKNKKTDHYEFVEEKDKLLDNVDGRFFYEPDGSVFFASIYGKHYRSSDGVYLLKLKNGKLEMKYLPYSTKVRAGYMSASNASKGKPIDYMGVVDFKRTEDGSNVLIVEQAWDQVGNSSITNIEPISVIKYGQNWEEKWSAVVPQKQCCYSRFAGYLHSSILYSGSNIYFVFNDNKKNIGLIDAEKCKDMPSLDDAIVEIATVSEGGDVKKEVLFKNSDEDVSIMPYKCCVLDKNDIALFCKKKNLIRFAKLTVE